MKNQFTSGLLTIAATVLPLSQGAIAGEMWRTEEYNVVHTEDRGDTAIWTYGNGVGTVFIEGLAGETENRGTYDGYWVQDKAFIKCDTYREGADGKPNHYWGTVTVKFIDADLPSRWELSLGSCHQEHRITLNGIPVVE